MTGTTLEETEILVDLFTVHWYKLNNKIAC